MNAAEIIIDKFGGQTALAELIGKRQSNVSYWAKTGSIPARWRPKLISIAREKGVPLVAEDFDIVVEVVEENRSISLEKATHYGELLLGDISIPCYVLTNGQRIFSLRGAVSGLTGIIGGALGAYIKVKAISQNLPPELVPEENGSIPALVSFDSGGHAFAKEAVGIPVERFIDICIAFSKAAQDAAKPGAHPLTDRQNEIAEKANVFLRSTAKVGIIALVDEATGYQYDRPVDALQFKLNLFLEKEMREWEKTFPDKLWEEFGRLTNWKGSIQHRPKYWGKLVNELVYSYLDEDVYRWLKKNAPKPIGNLSYHRWLSSQYGLKKLTEHLWQLVGMASACHTMEELRRKMGEKYGRIPVQYTLFVPPEQMKTPEN